MKQILVAIVLMFLLSCQDNRDLTKYCYTDTFEHVEQKNSTDTIKFYGFTDLDSAFACARKQNKPVLLVFAGWFSVSVHGLEWRTLSLFDDNDFIQNNYVIAWLQVDDRRLLTDTTKTDTIYDNAFRQRTIGNKYQLLQMRLASINTQPCFCIVDTNVTRYGNLMSYTKDKSEVKDFVLSGLKK